MVASTGERCLRIRLLWANSVQLLSDQFSPSGLHESRTAPSFPAQIIYVEPCSELRMERGFAEKLRLGVQRANRNGSSPVRDRMAATVAAILPIEISGVCRTRPGSSVFMNGRTKLAALLCWLTLAAGSHVNAQQAHRVSSLAAVSSNLQCRGGGGARDRV